MSFAVARAHSYIDGFLEAVEEQSSIDGKPIRCKGPGCFWCCKEPVFVERSEAQHIIEVWPEFRLHELARLASAWWESFWGLGLNKMPRPSEIKGYGWLFRYRAANLWCPLLADGLCTVYQYRPGSCRMHLAIGHPAKCRDDKDRPKQRWVETAKSMPPHVASMATAYLVDNAPKALLEYDHLGIWLGHLLLGKTDRSNGSSVAIVEQNDPQDIEGMGSLSYGQKYIKYPKREDNYGLPPG